MEVLIALEKWGILGIGQLEALVFRKAVLPHERLPLFFNEYPRSDHSRYAYKRLSRLDQAGYIHSNFYVNLPRLYTLTLKGHKLLQGNGSARFPGFRGSISDFMVNHEITVNAVGLVMSELLGLEVSTERERFVWSRHGGWAPAPSRLAVSDLWIVDQEQPKAIEVELVQKSEGRYREIWEAYRRRRPINGAVLYLTGWPGGPDCLLDYAKQFRMDFIHVCGLREFRDSHGLAPFMGFKIGQVIRLKPRAGEPESRRLHLAPSKTTFEDGCTRASFASAPSRGIAPQLTGGAAR